MARSAVGWPSVDWRMATTLACVIGAKGQLRCSRAWGGGILGTAAGRPW